MFHWVMARARFAARVGAEAGFESRRANGGGRVRKSPAKLLGWTASDC